MKTQYLATLPEAQFIPANSALPVLFSSVAEISDDLETLNDGGAVKAWDVRHRTFNIALRASLPFHATLFKNEEAFRQISAGSTDVNITIQDVQSKRGDVYKVIVGNLSETEELEINPAPVYTNLSILG